MILVEVRRYLKQRWRATLEDIAFHVEADPRAVQGMLEQWIRKGKVRRYLLSESCGSRCNGCNTGAVEIFEWIDAHPAPRPGQTVPLVAPCGERPLDRA